MTLPYAPDRYPFALERDVGDGVGVELAGVSLAGEDGVGDQAGLGVVTGSHDGGDAGASPHFRSPPGRRP